MKKYIKYCLIVVFSLVFLVNYAFAAEFALTKIGSMDTSGNNYTEWWYSQTNPLLTGTAEANSSVAVRVDGDTHSVTADSEGNWSYQMNKGEGDYEVEVSDGSTGYTFTLHLGQPYPGDSVTGAVSQTTQTGNAVPETGYEQIAGITMGLGVILLGTYLYMWGDTSKRVSIRRRDIDE